MRKLMQAVFSRTMCWEFFASTPFTLVQQSAQRERVPDASIAEGLSQLSEPSCTAAYVAPCSRVEAPQLALDVRAEGASERSALATMIAFSELPGQRHMSTLGIDGGRRAQRVLKRGQPC